MANDNSGSVMLAFVFGALTGAAVALLFAPATGEETREYLGQKAREGKAKAARRWKGREFYRASGNVARRRARPRGVPAGARARRPGVTETGELFLGIIALAVVVMAAIQVAAIIAGLRLARRVDALAAQIDQELKPLIANLTALSSEAARAASLAARQVERLDRVFGEMVERVDKTLAAAQEFVTGPARQGMAIMSGVKAVLDLFRTCASRLAGAPRRVPAWTKRNRFSSADRVTMGA